MPTPWRESVYIRRISEWDARIMAVALGWRKPWITPVMKVITHSGGLEAYLFVAVLALLLNVGGVAFVPKQGAFLQALLCAFIARGLGALIKKHFRRTRPSIKIKDYHILVKLPRDTSFPSIHTAAALAFFLALSLHHHPYAWAAGVWALTVAFSRVYLGVHYPSDLLGGAVLSILSVAAHLLL